MQPVIEPTGGAAGGNTQSSPTTLETEGKLAGTESGPRDSGTQSTTESQSDDGHSDQMDASQCDVYPGTNLSAGSGEESGDESGSTPNTTDVKESTSTQPDSRAHYLARSPG